MTLQLSQNPGQYTLALNGNIQRLTLCKDVDGNTLDAGGAVNIWADRILLAVSNDAVAGTDKCFVAYKDGGSAPATLDKTNSIMVLIPSNDFSEIPNNNAAKPRGAQINARFVYVKGVNGDYLNISMPGVKPITGL